MIQVMDRCANAPGNCVKAASMRPFAEGTPFRKIIFWRDIK